MARFFKNIYRLQSAFLPLFLTSALAVFLMLLCLSMSISCEDELCDIHDGFDITLTVAPIEQGNYEKDPDTGEYDYVFKYAKRIDRKAIESMEKNPFVSDIQMISREPIDCSIEYVTSEREFESIKNVLQNGGSAVRESLGYDSEKYPHLAGMYSFSVMASSSAEDIPYTLGYSENEIKITMLDGMEYDDGLIVSKLIYDAYSEPRSLVFGWYITIGGAPVLNDGSYVSQKADIAKWADTYMTTEKAPQLTVPIAGYYETSDTEEYPLAVSNIDHWDKIYAAMDYYTIVDGGQNFDREGASAIDEIGFTRVELTVNDPKNTADAIRCLLDAGLDTKNFSVSANDYDYKFAVSQLESIQSFADISLYASVVFGILIVTLLLFYSVKKRSGEVYTMRTLGYGRAKIIISIGCEVAFVLLLAVTFGILFSYLSGDAICGAINNYTENSVKGTVSNLSEVSELMQNSEERKAQISGAANAFIENGFGVSYSVPNEIYAVIYTAWACFAVLSMLLVGKLTLRSLMKRG